MDKRKCNNPNCGKLFMPEGLGKNERKYCCAKCKDVARDLRCGTIPSFDNFNTWRKGVIKLSNGIEIRNDAMGKEISQPMSIYHNNL